jgi:hypothetical protein
MSSSYRQELNKWLSRLDVKTDRVLDIGGSQEALSPRVKSWDVGEYLIADLPSPHKDSPKPDIEMDLNKSFGNLQHYDMIFCLEVFEYVYDPLTAMKTISTLLSTKGTAWVTFPSVYPMHQPIEDDALRYMPGGINKLAEAVGLTIVQMIPRRFETGAWNQTISAEGLRAAKGEDHNFSGWIVEFKK